MFVFVLAYIFKRFSWEIIIWNVPGVGFFTNLIILNVILKKKKPCPKIGVLFSSKRVPLSRNRKGYCVVKMLIKNSFQQDIFSSTCLKIHCNK